MKFLSLRTVYRVFPIIKHSKTLGPGLILTPGPIDLKKYSVGLSHQGLSTCQISWRLVEKWRRNRGSHVAVKKNKKEEKNNKKQNKNRKVFRRCRQTLINRTKTERSADCVRQTLKKEKTEQKQKGLLTASGRPYWNCLILEVVGLLFWGFTSLDKVIFQPYRDLEEGDNQCLKPWPGI